MGHHRRRGAFNRLGRSPLLLALVLVAALAASALGLRVARSASSTADTRCAGPTTALSVGADPAGLDWIGQLAARYSAARHRADGRCIVVTVREMSAEEAQQALQPVPFPGGGAPPDVWVPDSTTALDLVRSRSANAGLLPASAESIASSPIVLAAPSDAVHAVQVPPGRQPTLADFLRLAVDPRGWGQPRSSSHPEWGPVHFALADPARSTIGVNLLVAAAGAASGTPTVAVTGATFTLAAAQQALLLLSRSAASAGRSTGELLAGVAGTTTTQDELTRYGLVAAYESDVYRYNLGSPAVLLAAAYPLGGALAADYPFVVPNGSWVSAQSHHAAADFQSWLRSPGVQDQLGEWGLRRANGTAGPQLAAPAVGLSTAPVTPRGLGSPATPAAARSAWRLLTQHVSILALVDVSGSMAAVVPGTNQTKLQVAIAAAGNSLQFFADADRIGLWEFSSQLAGARDYRELVPLGPAGGTVGGRTRRQASLAAYATLTPGGSTGLYNSVFAAYSAAQAQYQPGFVNAIVVLTDGVNESPTGLNLPTLLAKLTAAYNPSQPVHVVTIGYGQDADPQVLSQIAKATEGLSFMSVDPRNIGQVFLTALTALTG